MLAHVTVHSVFRPLCQPLQGSSNSAFSVLFLKLVMEDIFISGDPLLESVGLHEPLVEELRANITNAMHKAMIPLQAYAKEYRKYLELNNNDISTFLKYVCVRVCV